MAHNTSMADVLLLSETPTVIDANILYSNGLSSIETLKNQSLILNFYSQDFTSLSSYYFSFVWFQENQAIQTSYIIGEDQVLLSPRSGPGSEVYSFTGGFDKFFDFVNSTISVSSSFTRTYIPLFINDVFSSSSNYIASNKISFINTSSKKVRFNATFSDTRSWSDFTNEGDFALFQKLTLGTQIIPSKGILIGLHNQWYFNRNSRTTSFLNFKSSWETSKKFSIGLEGINILSNDIFSIRDINNQSEILDVTSLRNPLFLFKLEIDF